jgi:hypothetical protein
MKQRFINKDSRLRVESISCVINGYKIDDINKITCPICCGKMKLVSFGFKDTKHEMSGIDNPLHTIADINGIGKTSLCLVHERRIITYQVEMECMDGCCHLNFDVSNVEQKFGTEHINDVHYESK